MDRGVDLAHALDGDTILARMGLRVPWTALQPLPVVALYDTRAWQRLSTAIDLVVDLVVQ